MQLVLNTKSMIETKMEERKMRVLDTEFVKNFIRTANDGWE